MKWKDAFSQKEYNMLWKAIPIDLEHQRMISFVGAGGKTTLLYTLAEELAGLHYRVIVTTTTHMRKPVNHYCEWEEVRNVNPGEVLTVGVSCGSGKIKGMENVPYEMLFQYADFVLVEADGSRGMPLKVPAGHEPVLLSGTDVVVGVLGYQSIGKSISETAHRMEDVAGFLKKNENDTVTAEDLEQISFSEKGLKKGVSVPFRVIWNQWNGEEIVFAKKYPVLLCEREKMW